jgi:hypothetical protein
LLRLLSLIRVGAGVGVNHCARKHKPDRTHVSMKLPPFW